MADGENNLSESALAETGGFIHAFIQKDLEGRLQDICTRFPPEPNGFLHIGHAKAILLNYGLAKMYGGKFNLRFDDTNPAKEEMQYVNGIIEDVKWLIGNDFDLYYGSDYFEQTYEYAIDLIQKSKAYVCELTPDEVKEYRGTLNEPGKNSPYRDRSVEENLELFKGMREGKFPDGSKTLRAKIDMSSPNINMRDPIIYRIARLHHHNTGDKWCIYPTYDYAHPLQDAAEKITHSLCSLEFEDHRPLYDWVINTLDCFDPKPRQIEFAKLYLTNTVSGKRYIKKLVEDGEVDGWDDPRLITICGVRRRGYTPEALKNFCEKIGISKANSRVDISFLEHCVRDDLKPKSQMLMAILNPVKLVITNYPDDKEEFLTIENNAENEEMGTREVPFSKELYIERSDFMEEAPKKYHRLTPGQEVRLKGAYFVTCTDFVKDDNGNITEIHATYDPATKSGSGFDARKVKGTIHWVSAKRAVKVTANKLDYLVYDDEEAEFGIRKNPNSMEVFENCYVEPHINELDLDTVRLQFLRNGYFFKDFKLSTRENGLVFNEIVALKSSYKPPDNK
ncbi:MAG: glutamine--tRNA ligase/YqeY domain fusion protein [Defluviitaleaceae bacterium]|nr:glutamine--tRNA ligase/YqeY domain fusion protein [Defluviitaleaceae bacterium]